MQPVGLLLFVLLAGVPASIGLVWTALIAARTDWKWLLAFLPPFFVLGFPAFLIVRLWKGETESEPSVRKPAFLFGLSLVGGVVTSFLHLSRQDPLRDVLGPLLSGLGGMLMIGAVVWTVRESYRTVRWWWIPPACLVAVPVFAVRHCNVARCPALLFASSIGALVFGDLIADRRPEEKGRTLGMLLYGCQGGSFREQLRKLHCGKERMFADLRRVTVSPEGQFSPSLGYACATVASLAYENKNELEKLSRSLGFSEQRVRFIEAGNHVAITMAVDGVVFAAFRGTKSVEDMLSDAKILPRRTKWGNMHTGFWEGVDGLYSTTEWQEVLASLNEVVPQPLLVFTGHSLGGALAAIAAARLAWEKGLLVTALYTFGQPKVGDSEAAEQIAKAVPRYYRVVHGEDPVVAQPAISVRLAWKYWWSYQHAGQFVYLHSAGKFHLDQLPRVESFREGLCADVPSPHGLRWYLAHLKLKADGQ